MADTKADTKDELKLEINHFTTTVVDFQERLERLNTDLLHHAKLSQTVTHVSRLILSTLDHRNILRRLLRELISSLKVERASFWLVNHEKQIVEFQFSLNYQGLEDEISEIIRLLPANRFKIGGETLVGRVAESGVPLIENIPHDNPHYYREMEKETKYEVQRIITVPIQQDGKTTAVLQFLNPLDGRMFNRQDQTLLMSISPWVAVALKNANLYTEAVRQQQLMESVSDIGRKLISTLDYHDVLRQLINELINRFRVSRGSFWLVDHQHDQVNFQFSLNHRGEEDEISHVLSRLQSSTFRIGGSSLVGQVALTGQPIIENEPESNPHHYKGIDHNFPYQTQRILCVPLIRHQTTIGVLQLLNPIDNRKFTLEDQRILTAITPWVALALENASMYGRALDEARIAHEQRMQAELDAREAESEAAAADMARSLAHHLKNKLGGARVDLYQLKRESRFSAEQIMLVNEIDADIKRSIELSAALFKPYRSEPREPGVLFDLVNQAIENISIVADDKIAIDNNISAEISCQIEKNQVTGHLEELITNAWRAIQKGKDNYRGSIQISAETKGAREIWIHIDNDGPPIAEDRWQAIFKKFVSSNENRHAHNYGLGLWAARIYFRRQGGDLYVSESNETRTRFTIVVPHIAIA